MKKILGWLYWFAVILSLLILAIRLANWGIKHGHSLPALPQPNGYDEILAAASSIKPPASDLSDLTPDQVRQLADQNRPALERARAAFQMESRVSLKPTRAWDDHHDDNLASLRRLAVAFGVEASVKMRDHQTDEAAACAMDMMRLADRTGRGGIITDGITSLTIEALALGELRPVIPQLDAEFCRKAGLEMEGLLDLRETPETTFATERTWSAIRFGVVDLIGSRLLKKDETKREEKFDQHYKDAVQRTQHLMLRMASHAYELDNKHEPTDVASLVPQYLKAMPKDFETGKEIHELPSVSQ